MKMVICDDSAEDIAYVTGLIGSWKKQTGTAVELLSFPCLLYTSPSPRDP